MSMGSNLKLLDVHVCAMYGAEMADYFSPFLLELTPLLNTIQFKVSLTNFFTGLAGSQGKL
jgi:hypothetical protein